MSLIFPADDMLADRSRLSIMAFLAALPKSIEFTKLVIELGLTKGNLSSHLRKLEEAKYIEVTKEFVDRKPRSSYQATSLGRKAIKTYLKQIEETIRRLGS